MCPRVLGDVISLQKGCYITWALNWAATFDDRYSVMFNKPEACLRNNCSYGNFLSSCQKSTETVAKFLSRKKVNEKV